LSEPQPVPEHVVVLVCARLQETPLLRVSFATVAMKFNDCPSSIEIDAFGWI